MEQNIGKRALEIKLKNLKKCIREYESLAVAFSGGGDSTFLLKTVFDVLNKKVLAVTAITPATPSEEVNKAKEFVNALGIPHKILKINCLDVPEVKENSRLRCYFCKKMIFTEIKKMCKRVGIPNVADGSNVDDMKAYRPGKKALKELEILSPLVKCGLTKNDIRTLSKKIGIANWDSPAQSCLLTRFEYDRIIDENMLEKVDKAERVLSEYGFSFSRVRVFQDKVIVEVDPKLIDRFKNKVLKEEIRIKIRDLGYESIELDPKGYRTGRMDEGVLNGE